MNYEKNNFLLSTIKIQRRKSRKNEKVCYNYVCFIYKVKPCSVMKRNGRETLNICPENCGCSRIHRSCTRIKAILPFNPTLKLALILVQDLWIRLLISPVSFEYDVTVILLLGVSFVDKSNKALPIISKMLNILLFTLYTVCTVYTFELQKLKNFLNFFLHIEKAPKTVEGLYCKRPTQCLASSEILTPHPLTARRMCSPPPLVRGEDTLPRWRGGGGFGRRQTLLCTLYM